MTNKLKMVKYTSNKYKSPIVIHTLRIILFLLHQIIYSQNQEFKFKDDVGEINTTISLDIYKNGHQTNFLSDLEGNLKIDIQKIKNADSIFINHSFYRLPLQKEDFTQNPIKLNPEIALEEVVLKEKTKVYLGPDKNNSGLGLTSGTSVMVSLNTESINFKRIIGIRFKLKKRGIGLGNTEGNQFKIMLFGFNQLTYRYEENTKENVAYNLLGENEILMVVPEKTSDWVEFYFQDIEVNYSDYKYIAFGFKALQNIIIHTTKKKHFPEFEEAHLSGYYISDPEKKRYIYHFDKDYVPNIQLILK